MVIVCNTPIIDMLLSSPFSASKSELGYAYLLPPGSNVTLDGELMESTDEGHMVLVNGTIIRIVLKKPFRDSEINELLYVIIVIVFYATALMTLIITQIKRQRREGTDVDYYDEYLQRNQEVKRTCQTATTIVLKADRPPPAGPSTATPTTSASGCGERGSSHSLLEPPTRGRDLSPRSGQRHAMGLNRGAGAGVGGTDDVTYLSPSMSPRELSPMLESIPDIGT